MMVKMAKVEKKAVKMAATVKVVKNGQKWPKRPKWPSLTPGIAPFVQTACVAHVHTTLRAQAGLEEGCSTAVQSGGGWGWFRSHRHLLRPHCQQCTIEALHKDGRLMTTNSTATAAHRGRGGAAAKSTGGTSRGGGGVEASDQLFAFGGAY